MPQNQLMAIKYFHAAKSFDGHKIFSCSKSIDGNKIFSCSKIL
jgi:hypothetical protein